MMRMNEKVLSLAVLPGPWWAMCDFKLPSNNPFVQTHNQAAMCVQLHTGAPCIEV